MNRKKTIQTLLSALLSTTCLSAEMILDATKGNVAKTEVTQSMLGLRDTLRFYKFVEQKAVLVVRIDNKGTDFPVSATLHVFGGDNTGESLDKWINNQHSDGLYADAPEPEASHGIPADACTVKSHELIGPVESHSGKFNRYRVVFEIKGVPAFGEIRTKDFSDTATVHVKARAG